MRHSRSIITAAVIIAIAVFVVAAVSSFISGNSEHYDRPSTPGEVIERMIQSEAETAEPAATAQTETSVDADQTSEQVTAAAQQEAEALQSNTTEDVVDNTSQAVESAIESAQESSQSVIDRANEAIATAESQAADGRAEAESRLEEVTKEAGVTTEDAAEEASAEETAAEEPTAATAPAATAPKTHTVAAQGLIYSPLVVTIAPGDTVSWTNMSTHNTESIEGLIPEGAEMWMSEMSDNYSRKFTVEGIYIYKCTPHFGTGMGGVIIVGNPVNLEEIKNFGAKGATRRLVNKAIEAAEAM